MHYIPIDRAKYPIAIAPNIAPEQTSLRYAWGHTAVSFEKKLDEKELNIVQPLELIAVRQYLISTNNALTTY